MRRVREYWRPPVRGRGQTPSVGYFTERLPRDVAPGQSAEVQAAFGLPEQAGRYSLRLDLVADKIAWFSQLGSPATDVEMIVTWSNSRDPHRFEARIDPLGSFPPHFEGDAFPLRLRVTNVGDTAWVAHPPEGKGTVRIGVQLLAVDGAVTELDYFRIPLPRPVEPGDTVEMEARVPKPAGRQSRFAVDLVAEQICWFAAHGSKPLSFTVQ